MAHNRRKNADDGKNTIHFAKEVRWLFAFSAEQFISHAPRLRGGRLHCSQDEKRYHFAWHSSHFVIVGATGESR